MMETTGPSQADHPVRPAETDEKELMRWRSLPARRSVKTTLLVVLVIIGIPALLVFWYGPFFGLLGMAILGGSLLSFFLPTSYRATDLTIYRTFLGIIQKRRWSEFRSFYPDKNGVLLSPFLLPSRLENFRGLYIRFADNREQVLALVKDRVPPSSREEEK